MKTLDELEGVVGCTCVCPLCGETIAIMEKQFDFNDLLLNFLSYLDSIFEGHHTLNFCPACKGEVYNSFINGPFWCLE